MPEISDAAVEKAANAWLTDGVCDHCGDDVPPGHHVDCLQAARAALEAALPHLYGWEMLLDCLDAVYPEDVFTGVSGDPGATIVTLARHNARLREAAKATLDWGVGSNTQHCFHCGVLPEHGPDCPFEALRAALESKP